MASPAPLQAHVHHGWQHVQWLLNKCQPVDSILCACAPSSLSCRLRVLSWRLAKTGHKPSACEVQLPDIAACGQRVQVIVDTQRTGAIELQGHTACNNDFCPEAGLDVMPEAALIWQERFC